MPIPFEFDWKRPDYAAVYRWRIERLRRIREAVALEAAEERPATVLPALKAYYRDHIAQFIIDWGMTYDPRNAGLPDPLHPGSTLPTMLPFLLFHRQEEWVEWFIDNWRKQIDGVTEKTREIGMSWLAVSVAISACLFNKGVSVGCGSRKEEYVDIIGDPDSLFEKGRMFLRNLPPEFRGGWTEKSGAHMKIIIPESGSIFTGEAGDGIGRGGRASFYIVDESAFLERPGKVDASLSATTRCRQDISTPNGRGNSFAERRFKPGANVFKYHWRDDPRKDDVWYAQQQERLPATIVAQEIDINYDASLENVIIPQAWVQAAVDAHKKLGFMPSGMRRGALDVADEGKDKNAFGTTYGTVVEFLMQWSGKGSDPFETAVRAMGYCDHQGLSSFQYDADGLGASVRGDTRVINEERRAAGKREIMVDAFRGSGEVIDPTGEMFLERKNKDYFANFKAQSWWALHLRFRNTYRAVMALDGGPPFEWNEADIISLDSEAIGAEMLNQLMGELSQPTSKPNTTGKMVVDKAPDGTKSPNLADVIMILFNPSGGSMDTWARLAA